MSRFLPYCPDQAELLPPSVRDVLSVDHLCFFVHGAVERLDLSQFHASYAEEGGQLYHPSLMLKVWLYAYALGVTSSRRLEQRIQEDLAFRYLAGGAGPDYWALNAFRRRHRLAINDCFTQVVELARQMGMGQLGTVAIDATRIKASASPDKVVVQKRQQRARIRLKVRNWQKACDGDDNNEGAGMRLGAAAASIDSVQQLGLEPLERPGKRSATDPDAGFMYCRKRLVLGYSAQIAVSEDHLIVAQRVTQQANENRSLAPMIDLTRQTCGRPPGRVVADSGFYSNNVLEQLQRQDFEVYVPDSNLARELNMGHPAAEPPHQHPQLRAMRTKLRTEQGRKIYTRRKALVEPVFGVLKEQRGMKSFRMRGEQKVAIEFALAALAFNLTRMHKHV
jgi:transposase